MVGGTMDFAMYSAYLTDVVFDVNLMRTKNA